MNTITIKDFYSQLLGDCCPDLESFLTENIHKDIGHFNVFDIADISKNFKTKSEMPYNRRTYYKISLIQGRNRVEYANKTIEINDFALLFASPKIPYKYVQLDNKQSGYFAVFTKDFLSPFHKGLEIDQIPLFSANSDFIFQIDKSEFEELKRVFVKMSNEISSDYLYKFDLLRVLLMEIIHYGQKLQPVYPTKTNVNAASRITALFIELLELQFPIENPSQILQLRIPKDYANHLGVHVNHLNSVLKETTGKTTREIISSRIFQEASVLLKHTKWNISEIAYSLGFEEVAHFSNFFKKHSRLSPVAFRS
jgi:AraC-like DNA-binding protein